MRGPLFLSNVGEEKETSGHVLEAVNGKIDDPLLARLADGSIRLVLCSWLLSKEAEALLTSEPSGVMLMKRQQELPPEAFAEPEHAVSLLQRGDRSVLALSQ